MKGHEIMSEEKFKSWDFTLSAIAGKDTTTEEVHQYITDILATGLVELSKQGKNKDYLPVSLCKCTKSPNEIPYEDVSNTRNLTDEESEIYESRLESESSDTGVKLQILPDENEKEYKFDRESSEKFKDYGLLWFTNTILHMFGWTLTYNYNEDGVLDSVNPKRVKFRGFPEKSNTRGYRRVSKYLKENIDKLLEEANED